MKIPLEHEDLTGRIRQAAFETHCYFGSGFMEKIYENSLSRRLRKIGFNARQQQPITVRDEDDSVVGDYIADILVEELIIIEIKAVKSLLPIHEAQVHHYLKATGLTLGLLINFGADKLQFKRIIRTKK